MIEFVKNLLGIKKSGASFHRSESYDWRGDIGKSHNEEKRAPNFDPEIPSHEYYQKLQDLQAAISGQDYGLAARATRESLPLLNGWLNDPRREDKPLIFRIPALQQGGTMLAFTGDQQGISEMNALIDEHASLSDYRDDIEQHVVDLQLFERIREVVRDNPGTLQNKIKTKIGLDDGRRASRLVSYLEKGGEITRVKKGSTYELYCADVDLSEEVSAKLYVEPKTPISHRKNTRVQTPNELKIDSIKRVPLPPSPNKWEHPVNLPTTTEDFADPKGAWDNISIEDIPKEQRPDPAFRKHFTTRDGTLHFDDLAKSSESEGAPGAVMLTDLNSNIVRTAKLCRDPYQISVHPEGTGFALRSKSGVLSIYDEMLDIDFETDLESVPEVVANANRHELSNSEMHRALRCIALSPERDLYLFTHVDEAWCTTRDGALLWGLRTPMNEARHHETRSIIYGTENEIEEALDMMGLEMPVTPEDIRKRYRTLARQLHPDLNPGKEEDMKALNAASEKLTGLSIEELDGRTTNSTGVEVTFSVIFPERPDWIYAAAFSGSGETSLLGTYAGKVIRVDRKGKPQIIYDVGSTPARIVETDSYLYIMTSTRLYVLDGEHLVSIKDCNSKSDLIIQNGKVLLIERKGVRVFSEKGEPLGIAIAKAPIRRAYVDGEDIVLETRTQRGHFKKD